MTPALSREAYTYALVAGLVLGVAYTLSPLTVLTVPVLAVLVARAARDLSPRERQWLYGLLTVGVALRLAAVAVLFMSANADRPFATFFGDEEMFKFRSVWLRNIGLGVPISAADFSYAVEETGKSQYLFVLAFLQALVGSAPYGMHLFNMTLYLAGVLILYRLVRRSYGAVVAMGGLLVLLCLPSLFIWSISALKEPLYTLLAVTELLCVMQIARARRWSTRVACVAAVIILGVALESLRKGGLLVASVGCVAGLAAGFVATRPRLLLASAVLVPVGVAIAFVTPAIEQRVLSILRDSAIYHVGHVFTPGYSYKTLDAWYYIDPADVRRMPMGDALAYAARSLAGYVVQPVPWTIESRAMLIYLPEHMMWLAMAALVPVGLAAGLRRDALLTCVLIAHGLLIVMMVALTSGNVGTLIRHRGLALPYFVWFSALGACQLLQWFAARAKSTAVWHPQHVT